MADVKGLCHICGKAASKTCRICGRPTCEKHLSKGACKSCLSGKQ